MRGKIRKHLSLLIISAIMLGGIQLPVSAVAQETAPQTEADGVSGGVTVTTGEEFMNALE